MKYIGAILFCVIVCAIMVGGTYNRKELVQTSLQLVPIREARPELVETTLTHYNGIHSARLSATNDRLEITYDRARITLEDVSHILVTLGYRALMVEPEEMRAGM